MRKATRTAPAAILSPTGPRGLAAGAHVGQRAQTRRGQHAVPQPRQPDMESEDLRPQGNPGDHGDGWTFRPEKFVPSLGIGSALDTVRAVFGIRRAARTYLEKRGLPWPAVPWH